MDLSVVAHVDRETGMEIEQINPTCEGVRARLGAKESAEGPAFRTVVYDARIDRFDHEGGALIGVFAVTDQRGADDFGVIIEDRLHLFGVEGPRFGFNAFGGAATCLLYTSDAADE